jgi:1-acyl-sn-glycerol-3-phosphate acyltransferase
MGEKRTVFRCAVLSVTETQQGMGSEMKVHENASIGDKPYSLVIRGWYKLVRGVVGFLIRVLCRLKVEGWEHIPDKGPYLLITNHLHWLDPPVIAVVFPHRAYLFAAEKWERHWLLGPFFRSLDAIFVTRGEVDRKALRQAMAVLEGGGVLGMAPEGTRSKTGAMQRGRSGAAYMAYRAGVPLVPVVTWGQESVFHSLWRLRRATVRVVFGAGFTPPPTDGKASAAEVHAFAEEIMYRMAAMLPPEYRGVYKDVAEQRPDLMALYATYSQ